MRADLMENLERAAAALEHVDEPVRIALVSTDIVREMAGEWSEPVRYRFREDGRPGFVTIDLKAEPEKKLLPGDTQPRIILFGPKSAMLHDPPMVASWLRHLLEDGPVLLYPPTDHELGAWNAEPAS